MATGDPCFGRTYNRVRAALVEAVVLSRENDWCCQLCEQRWPVSLADMELRHQAKHHDRGCPLSSPFNRGDWA